MTNQGHNPAQNADPARDSKGRWLVGTKSPNPTGKGGAERKGFASWRARVEAIESLYPTFKDLTKFFYIHEKMGLMPTPALGDLSAYDAGIVWQKIMQVFGSEKVGHMAREAFWDRYEGTPTQTIKHQGLATRLDEIPTNFASDEDAANAFADLLRTNGL